MKPASCEYHGRAHLINAGAPNVVRCNNGGHGCPGGEVLEAHLACRGDGCEECERSGWVRRQGKLGSPYPVS